jgi:mRNA interferase YafQ
MKKRGKDFEKLKAVVQLLAQEQTLPERYRDHTLVGDWSGYRDCHIEPDWLLLYKIERDEEILTLVRTGTHSDLFKLKQK